MSTHNIHFHDKIRKMLEIYLNIFFIFYCAIGRISQGLKNEFELAMVNEPSVFESLKFCCFV